MAISAMPVQLMDPTTGVPYKSGSGSLGATTSANSQSVAPATDATFVTKEADTSTVATAQVSVALTATQLVAARTGRRQLIITNITGAQQIFVGASGVGIATGALIPATVGASITINTSAALFGITTVAPQTVSVVEVY